MATSVSTSTSNEEVVGDQNQEDICQLCTGPRVLNSTLSSSLQSVKHLWSYLYHRNVREALVPLSRNSSDDDLEIGRVPKLTFILSAGQQQEINGWNHEHQLTICGNCILGLEKLEKLHRDREAVDKLIQDQVKKLEEMLSSQQNGNEADLDSRKMRSFMKAPQLNLAFAGMTIGKENISQALKFLNIVCDGMSSASSDIPPLPPHPSPSSISSSTQGETLSKSQQERSDISNTESTEAISCLKTEVGDLPLDSCQPEVQADPEGSSIVSGDFAATLSGEDYQQQREQDEPSSEKEECNGNETQTFTTLPPPSPGVRTTHQSPSEDSTEILRIKIEPMECAENTRNEMACPKESVPSEDLWLNDLLEGKGPILEDCHHPAGLKTKPYKSNPRKKGFTRVGNRDIRKHAQKRTKNANRRNATPILKFLNSTYDGKSSSPSTSTKSLPSSSCSTSKFPPSQTTIPTKEHHNFITEPLECSESKESKLKSQEPRFLDVLIKQTPHQSHLPGASLSIENNAGRPNVRPRGDPKTSSSSSKHYNKIHCPVCKVLVTNFSKLKRHMRIHSGEKPFKCKVCNKAFTQASNRDAHQHVHSNNKPFQCDICNKGFKLKSSLKRHYKSCHSTDKDKPGK